MKLKSQESVYTYGGDTEERSERKQDPAHGESRKCRMIRTVVLEPVNQAGAINQPQDPRRPDLGAKFFEDSITTKFFLWRGW